MCVLIQPGSILQLLIAFVFSLMCLLLTAVASPYRSNLDDSIAKAFGFALSAVFFFAVIVKVNVLTESVNPFLPQQLKDTFGFDFVLVSVCMTISVALSLVVTALVAVQQVLYAAQRPIVRLRSTHTSPVFTMGIGILWHLFLSHSRKSHLEP